MIVASPKKKNVDIRHHCFKYPHCQFINTKKWLVHNNISPMSVTFFPTFSPLHQTAGLTVVTRICDKRTLQPSLRNCGTVYVQASSWRLSLRTSAVGEFHAVLSVQLSHNTSTMDVDKSIASSELVILTPMFFFPLSSLFSSQHRRLALARTAVSTCCQCFRSFLTSGI